MVNIHRKRCCSHDSCSKKPSFNIKDSKLAVYCKHHAKNGMVNIRSRRCSHESCMTPSFNIKGSKTAVYCKQHIEEGMVNIISKRCSHDSCSRQPSFNVEGSKTIVRCKEHAEDGIVEVHRRRCSHISCIERPTWGVLTDSAAIACTRHKSDLSGRPVINFTAKCKIAGCQQLSRWGFHEKQPTHCGDHGPLMEGLMCTIAPARNKSSCPRPSYGPVRGPSFHVKTECLF